MKETKLVHHGDAYEMQDERHPLKAIAAAIKNGWRELRAQPRYLDLPAYDGVRCPYPASSQDDVGAVDRILVLCPFRNSYTRNWRFLSGALAQHYPSRGPTRMLDIRSPRLVGQALYEGIRWSRTCIIDWTGWRANVFFEFGVRLACSNIGPVCVMDADDPAPGGEDQQRNRLRAMWSPTMYRVPLDDDPRLAEMNRRPLWEAFKVHDEVAADRAPAVPLAALPHDATYRTCRQTFEWAQEGMTIEPHEMLRRSVVEPFGPDRQNTGVQPILYAADNASFSLALELSVRERWIAAWYYVANRYPREKWSADPVLRDKVRTLANQVLQNGPRKDETDPLLITLRDTLYEVIDEIEEINTQQPAT